MHNKEQFTEAMFFLAEMTGKDLSDQTFNFYFKEFEPDLIKATNIIMSFAKDAKWPSINQIKDKMGICAHEPDNEQKARLLTQKVVQAIGKFGWSNESSAKEWFGAHDWEIVTRYLSWSQICDVDNDGLQTFQAQFREFSKSFMHNKKYENHLSLNSEIRDLIEIDSLTRRLQ